MSRFSFVKHDPAATLAQAELLEAAKLLESRIDRMVYSPRSKAMALTKLEECFMWIGKAIRDDQLERLKRQEP